MFDGRDVDGCLVFFATGDLGTLGAVEEGADDAFLADDAGALLEAGAVVFMAVGCFDIIAVGLLGFVATGALVPAFIIGAVEAAFASGAFEAIGALDVGDFLDLSVFELVGLVSCMEKFEDITREMLRSVSEKRKKDM